MAQLSSSTVFGDLTVTNNINIFGSLNSTSINIGGVRKDENWDIAYTHSQTAHAPSNANYYVHPSVNHIPTGGAAGNILQWSSSGTAAWKANGTTSQYLRGDGSWSTPPNDNTASAVDNILSGSNSGTAITYQPYTTSQATTGNRFYTHNTMPTATTLLNLSSHLRITQGTIGTTLTVNGDIIGNGKVIARTTDGWLRLNPTYTSSPPATAFHSGVFIPSALSVSGNVGIGTTSPSDPLHVVGNMRFTGTLQEGTVPWARISGAPATATRWPTWEEVTDKPSTFAPSSHTHSYLPLSGGTLTGNLYTTSSARIGIGTSTAPAYGSIHIAPDGVANGLCIGSTSNTFRLYQASNIAYITRGGVNERGIAINATGDVGIGTTAPAYKLDVSGDVRATGTFRGSLTGNASTATTLATARTINGTSFNGSANITTANWGTARTLTIGSTGKSVDGSANVSWTLAEIGAAASSHSHSVINALPQYSWKNDTPPRNYSGISASFVRSETDGFPSYGAVLTVATYSNDGGNFQIYSPYNNTYGGTMKVRWGLYNNAGWTPWYDLWHSGNVPATATRWPTWGEVTGKPSTFAPSSHTHDYLPNSYLSGRSVADANLGQSAGVTVHYLTQGSINAPPGTDHSLLTMSYSNIWSTQLAGDWRTNEWYVRNQNSGVWGEWRKLWHSGNVPDTATRWPTWEEVTGKPSTFAPASHNHSYLPLSGGTLSGVLKVSQEMTAGTTAAFTNPHLALASTNDADETGFVGMTFATSTSENYGFSLGALRSTSGNGSMVLRFHSSSAAGTEVARITHTGDLTATRIYNAVYNDYAEYFLKDEQEIEPGDIIIKNPDGDGFIKSQKAKSNLVVGVMSTNYAQCIGGDKNVPVEEQEEKYAPVGLAGRLPVKVVGKVELGDLIVSSEIPGVGMASKEYIPGTVVGKALESYDSDEVGKIEMLIMNI